MLHADQLELALELEEARAVRSWRAHVTALLSIPLASVAFFPDLFSDVGRRAALTCWGLSVAGTVWAVIVEWRLLRRAAV